MAKEKKIKAPKVQTSKKAKKGFVLTVGDEGAILTHFDKGLLLNRIFVDSPFSPDIKLMKKLFMLYPNLPITVYVDIIEQNYVHSNLPPLSASAVNRQAARKLARDFQPNDLNNYVALGREKEGRKDWKYLFISLANSEPFSNWIELVLEQKNKLNGIYVLAIESYEMVADLNSKITDLPNFKWEILVMHNKVSGFRIITYHNKKIYFTRLTQHIIGENIAEVVAGNLEQEIVNTIEYLKRLGYTGEQDTHISLIANADVLKKLELSRMKFGKIDRYTPFSAAEKLGLQYAIKDNDKYADILCATHFISSKKRHLVFSTKLSKEISKLQTNIKVLSIAGFVIFAIFIGLLINLSIERPEIERTFSGAATSLKESDLSLQKLRKKQELLPKNIDLMVEVLDLNRKMPDKEDLLTQMIYRAVQDLPTTSQISKIDIVFNDYTIAAPKPAEQQNQFSDSEFANPFMAPPEQAAQETKKAELDIITLNHSFEGKIGLNLNVKRGELDILNDISTNLLAKLQVNKNGIEFSYELAPKTEQANVSEAVTDYEEVRLKELVAIPAVIKFKGTFSEEKKSN